MKNIINFLKESAGDTVEMSTTLYNFIYFYFNGVNEKSLESADGLFELNDCIDDYDTKGQFKTYSDWFKYFEKHKNDKIKVRFEPGEYTEAICLFKLPDVKYDYEWDCVSTPIEARDELRELNKKNK